ncbi:mannose-1-phosphate guanylyltransferase [Candidatus Dependentiae bacterium]|nr:mannose-1-phosphate guanylyltransferase [Candidatus Dependentiae bacterium]
MKANNVYFVILCGGSGTRLWPLSRKDRPKQLLPFLDNKSLLEQTIDRITPIARDKKNIGIITTQEQHSLIPQVIREKVGITLTEPTGRNTGPAILYSCFEIKKMNPNSVVVFLPADHFIPETEKFCSYLEKAINYATITNKIVTLGLMPTFPAIGYGYIQAATSTQVKAGIPYKVANFHEKPTREKALEYIRRGDMFWNLGMFAGKAKNFIEEYHKHDQEIFSRVSNYVKTKTGYEHVPSISIDFAIMEKSENVSIIPCDFEWNDVGNLDLFLHIQQQHCCRKKEKIINIDGKNNIAKTNKKLISFIGVDNLCVIEDGDVIVVSKRSEIERVKEILPVLKAEKIDKLL